MSTPQLPSFQTGCLPCAIRTKLAHKKDPERPIPDLPPLKTCITWQVAEVNGLPVNFPVCMEHLQTDNNRLVSG